MHAPLCSLGTYMYIFFTFVTLNVMYIVWFLGLDPFTDYSVSVAATNQQRGTGAFSSAMMTRTREGGEEISKNSVDHKGVLLDLYL